MHLGLHNMEHMVADLKHKEEFML